MWQHEHSWSVCIWFQDCANLRPLSPCPRRPLPHLSLCAYCSISKTLLELLRNITRVVTPSHESQPPKHYCTNWKTLLKHPRNFTCVMTPSGVSTLKTSLTHLKNFIKTPEKHYSCYDAFSGASHGLKLRSITKPNQNFTRTPERHYSCYDTFPGVSASKTLLYQLKNCTEAPKQIYLCHDAFAHLPGRLGGPYESCKNISGLAPPRCPFGTTVAQNISTSGWSWWSGENPNNIE